MQKHIWIIDDEQAICWALQRAVTQAGYHATSFSNAEDALAKLTKNTPLDAVILDMRMPGMDGFEATAIIKKSHPHIPVILMTAFGDLASAIHAIELDIFEYLTKPFDLADALKAISKAVSKRQQPESAAQVSSQLLQDTLLGSSAAMQSVYKQIAIASKSDVPVLLFGPSGCGKESVAAAIHRHSGRAGEPFVVFSPLAIPPVAVALELLGSSQLPGATLPDATLPNAKTAGSHYRSGALDLAGNGVLYIDEVGDLPLSLQSQLLRVIEHKQFTPLGCAEPRKCNARIIVSSTRSLANLEADGEISAELNHRLSVFQIEMKPLAERREDIVPLANAFLNASRPNLRFSKDAEGWLLSRPWSGNLRELQSVVQRAALIARGDRIELDDVSKETRSELPHDKDDFAGIGDAIRKWTKQHLEKLNESGQLVSDANADEVYGSMYEDFLANIEPPFLQAMMNAFDGNRAAIAAQLGLHRSTLRQKMKRYDIG